MKSQAYNNSPLDAALKDLSQSLCCQKGFTPQDLDKADEQLSLIFDAVWAQSVKMGGEYMKAALDEKRPENEIDAQHIENLVEGFLAVSVLPTSHFVEQEIICLKLSRVIEIVQTTGVVKGVLSTDEYKEFAASTKH